MRSYQQICHQMEHLSSTSFLLSAAIILIACYLFVYVIRPYQTYLFYKQLLTAHYKAKVRPFKVINKLYFDFMFDDLDKRGDIAYTIKHDFPKYQLVYSNYKQNGFISLIDHDLLKQFYQKNTEGYYVKSMDMPFISSCLPLVGRGLVLSEGQEWKKKRKIMSNVFNFDFIKGQLGTISSIASAVLDQMEAEKENEGKDEVTTDLNVLLQKIFGNIVIRCFFGKIELNTIGGEPLFEFANNLLAKNYERSITLFPFLVGSNFWKYNLRAVDREMTSKIKVFRQYCQQAIERLLASVDAQKKERGQFKSSGVIQMLIREEKLMEKGCSLNHQEEKYSYQDLIDEFSNFFFAGTETTANVTSLLIYQLTKYPQVEKKVRAEIDEVVGEDLSSITVDKLRSLVYLECVQKQILRMFPPLNGIFVREAVKDHYLDKIPIKKGTQICAEILANQFNTKVFPNPDEFNPDRWLNSQVEKSSLYSYFPFSRGPRVCLGQQLAMIQGKIAVVMLLKRYKKAALENPEFRIVYNPLYKAEQMKITFTK